MRKILSRLQQKMKRLGAEHADLRFVELDRTRIRTKEAALDEVKETHSSGVGFRVLKNGCFGFSSTGDLSDRSLLSHLEQAYDMAVKFSAVRHAEVRLVKPKSVRAQWSTPVRIDPWSLSLKEKMAPIVSGEKKILATKSIDSTAGFIDCTRKKTTFLSASGSWIEQTLYRTGGLISGEMWSSPSPQPSPRKRGEGDKYSKVGEPEEGKKYFPSPSGRGQGEGKEKIKRSYPGAGAIYRAEGFEAIRDFEFEKEAVRVGRELKELADAPEAPAGTFDLILKGSILALQIHETFGHASESDRLYGYEDNFGGRTFLNPGLLKSFPVASRAVSIVSDPRPQSVGAGSFAYDDEGVPAQKTEIIRNGIFREYLTSLETAYFLNEDGSSANMVAQDWRHYPLIRMTNTNLMPGRGSLARMIRDTKEGYLLDNELSWSVDELRLDFQIGAEAGYHIRDGKIRGLVRFPFYHGNSLDFWQSCDSVAGKSEWALWGFADCGKGGPYQDAFVGHGVSPALFKNVEFGRE